MKKIVIGLVLLCSGFLAGHLAVNHVEAENAEEKIQSRTENAGLGQATYHAFYGVGDEIEFPKEGFEISDTHHFDVIEEGDYVRVVAKTDGPAEVSVRYSSDRGDRREVNAYLTFDESFVNHWNTAPKKPLAQISDNSSFVGRFDGPYDHDSFVFDATSTDYSMELTLQGNIMMFACKLYEQNEDGQWQEAGYPVYDENGEEIDWVSMSWWFDRENVQNTWHVTVDEMKLEPGKTYALTLNNDIYNGIGTQYSVDLYKHE